MAREPGAVEDWVVIRNVERVAVNMKRNIDGEIGYLTFNYHNPYNLIFSQE